MTDRTALDDFEQFVERHRRHLWQALVPISGPEAAHDALADALAAAWPRWDRIGPMDNPQGYVYVMARRLARRRTPPRAGVLPPPDPIEVPEVEPGLIAALVDLSEMQRQVVYLVDGFGWGLTDVARILDISVSTVRNHRARGIDRLRTHLHAGMETDA